MTEEKKEKAEEKKYPLKIGEEIKVESKCGLPFPLCPICGGTLELLNEISLVEYPPDNTIRSYMDVKCVDCEFDGNLMFEAYELYSSDDDEFWRVHHGELIIAENDRLKDKYGKEPKMRKSKNE